MEVDGWVRVDGMEWGKKGKEQDEEGGMDWMSDARLLSGNCNEWIEMK